tara:strand:- start:25 stop:726 length:702 start_codon:yes stop_codon:yes gene_type:complete
MLVSLLAEYGDLRVKIKEITEGIMDVIRNRVAAGSGSDFTKWSNYRGIAPPADPEADDTDTATDTTTDTTTDTPQPDTDTSTDTSTDNEQPNTQQSDPQPGLVNPEAVKANASLEGKIAYAKSKKWIGKQPTDKDKNYLNSVDVYVDPNRFVNVPPSQPYIEAKPPHDGIVTGSVRIPAVDWQKAQGLSGYGFEEGAPRVFNLTLAGWWDTGMPAYVNPNNEKLNKIIYSYYK